MEISMSPNGRLHDTALAILRHDSIEHKLAAADEAVQRWRAGELGLDDCVPPVILTEPGRPERPHLVAPCALAKRGPGTEAGRVALVHALAHIEFNAVNLAWDAVYRFRDLPRAFYDDWLKVAEEEALHFRLLNERLREMGSFYGAFDAHNGLWEMALRTAHDGVARMALVPRVLEARGLDVTPGMIARLRKVGDRRTVEILEIILRDEIGHVAIGSRWFSYLCDQRGMEPEAQFQRLVRQYSAGLIREPFHETARRQAGFSANEMDFLKRQARQ